MATDPAMNRAWVSESALSAQATTSGRSGPCPRATGEHRVRRVRVNPEVLRQAPARVVVADDALPGPGSALLHRLARALPRGPSRLLVRVTDLLHARLDVARHPIEKSSDPRRQALDGPFAPSG